MKNFITFEGCEGVGKTTQVRLAHEYLLKNGCDVIMTREPGGSVIAEKIRNIILDKENTGMSVMSEILLYLAARAQHLKDIIIPALDRGQLVLCDRYIDSTRAYQGAARNIEPEIIDKLNSTVIGDYKPELTVFLDVPPHIAFARKGGADKEDRMEREGMEFHKKVYEGYRQIAAEDPERFVCVDGGGTKPETHEKIIALLKARGIIR